MRNEFLFLEYGISQILKYLTFSNSSIEHSRGTFEQWLLNKSKNMSKKQKDELLSFHTDRLVNMQFTFPFMFYSSFIVTWFSFIEVNLLEICRKLDLTVGVQENSKRGIDRARLSLSKGAKYNFQQETWGELNLIRKMRNIIVHEQGRIDYLWSKPKEENKFVELKPFGNEVVYVHIEKNLFDYLRSYNLYGNYEYFYIRPTREYCRYLITFAENLFDHLDKNLPPKERQAKVG
jgi:hypothetical protein